MITSLNCTPLHITELHCFVLHCHKLYYKVQENEFLLVLVKVKLLIPLNDKVVVKELSATLGLKSKTIW